MHGFTTGRRRRLGPEQCAWLMEEARAGTSDREIAVVLGVSAYTVGEYRRVLGLKLPLGGQRQVWRTARVLPLLEDPALVELSDRKLAALAGCSRSVVRGYRRRLFGTRRPRQLDPAQRERSEAIRAVVEPLLASGMTYAEIARRAGCHKATVFNWRRRLAPGTIKVKEKKCLTDEPRKLRELRSTLGSLRRCLRTGDIAALRSLLARCAPPRTSPPS